MDFLADRVLPAIVLALLAVLALIVFVYLPVLVVAERECLRAGYPEARVTFDLERYCTTLDGAVTVRVEKQADK